MGIAWIRSSGWVAHSPVWSATPALNRSPSSSRMASRPRPLRGCHPPAALISNATTAPSGCSITRSTSRPPLVRQCPTVGVWSIHDVCLSISPTANVLSRWPNCRSAVASRLASRSAERPRSRAAMPESTTCSLGSLVVRARRVVPQAGRRWMRKDDSRRPV